MTILETLERGDFPLHVESESAALAERIADVAAGRRRVILFELVGAFDAAIDWEEAFAAVLLANAAVMVRSQKPVVKLLHLPFEPHPGWPLDVYPAFNAARSAMSGGFADLRNIDMWLKKVSGGDGRRAQDLPELDRFLGFFQAVGLSEAAGVSFQEAEFYYGATKSDGGGFGHFHAAADGALAIDLQIEGGAGTRLGFDQFRDFGAIRFFSSIDRERSRIVFDFSSDADAVAEVPALLTHLSDFDLLKEGAR